LNLAVAGSPAFPTGSVAATAIEWRFPRPDAEATLASYGESQSWKAPPSRRHANEAPGSEPNATATVTRLFAVLITAFGFSIRWVTGPVASIVKVRVAGVGSAAPETVARTRNV